MRAAPSTLSQTAILAVAAQVALLGCWATYSHRHAVLVWTLAFVAWVAAVALRPSPISASLWAAPFDAPGLQHVALGSFGMLLGTWADANFSIPPCMCCRWGPQTSTLVMVSEQLRTYGTLGMMVGCVAVMWLGRKTRSQGTTPSQGYLCLMELVGMCLGMVAVARPTASLMRSVPWGKLEGGHLIMVAGMALGAWMGRLLAEAIVSPPQRHKT